MGFLADYYNTGVTFHCFGCHKHLPTFHDAQYCVRANCYQVLCKNCKNCGLHDNTTTTPPSIVLTPTSININVKPITTYLDAWLQYQTQMGISRPEISQSDLQVDNGILRHIFKIYKSAGWDVDYTQQYTTLRFTIPLE